MQGSSTRMFALAVAGSVLAGCSEPAAAPSAADPLPALAVKPGDPGDASGRMLFQARLASLGDSRARGVVLVEVVGGSLAVTVHAAGLEPLHHTPQHIHLNPGCDPGGGILLNLDQGLTVAGEAPGTGTAYPMSNNGGVVSYHVSRPLSELLAAVNTYAGAGLTSTEELLAWLDLEDRNAHLHVPVGPPFPAVNCGPVDRLN